MNAHRSSVAALCLWVWFLAGPAYGEAPVEVEKGAAPPSMVQLGVAFDGAFPQVLDTLFNTTHYAGFAPGARLRAGLRRGRWDHSLTVGFNYGQLANRYAHPLLFVDLGLRYGALARAWEAPSLGLSAWVGARLSTGIHFHQFVLEDDAHAYWLTAYSLSPSAELRWEPSPRVSLRLEVAAALVGWVARRTALPENLNDSPATTDLLAQAHGGGAFATPLNYRQISAALLLELPLPGGFAQRVSYRFEEQLSARPSPLFILSHVFGFEVFRAF